MAATITGVAIIARNSRAASQAVVAAVSGPAGGAAGAIVSGGFGGRGSGGGSAAGARDAHPSRHFYVNVFIFMVTVEARTVVCIA